MKTAFVFPGQGAQSLGMMADFAVEYPQILQTFAEASDVLGFDLWKLCQDGPETALNRTELTQPAVLTASVALWRLWQQLAPFKPDYLAGHSLGEYSALVVSQVIAFEDAVALVHLRGKLMQSAVPAGVGAMAAVIGVDDEVVIQSCREAAQGDIVEAVNFNAPGQVVIAGTSAAVERASIRCKELGARRILPLSVSVPSHCALMREAAQQLEQALKTVPFQVPTIPVIHNVTADAESSPDHIGDNLVKQLYSPVRWTQSMIRLAELGVDQVVECGPGKVLTGLTKRCIDSARSLSTATVSDFIIARAALDEGAAK